MHAKHIGMYLPCDSTLAELRHAGCCLSCSGSLQDTALRSDLRKKKAALDSLDVEELESHRDELDHIHQLLDLWEQGPKARTQPPADRRATDGAQPLPQQPVLALTGPSGT